METDPKGQLGGLETSDAVRKRHATASHAFKCPACAKTNIEIIQECEENARANTDSSESTNEVEIPTELKLGYKDEMGKAADPEGDAPVSGTRTLRTDDDTESTQLAEGFVRTTPETNMPNSSSVPKPQPPGVAAYSARPAQGIPVPTRTVSLPPAPNVSMRQVQPVHQHRPHDEGVPLWVDRAIVVLVVLLLAMVSKVVLDL